MLKQWKELLFPQASYALNNWWRKNDSDMTWILSLIVPVVIVVQKIEILRWNLYKSIEFEWSLVDTKLRAKVSFGGVLDSSSDLGEVKESYLIRLIKLKWLWSTALLVIKFLQDNQVWGIMERYNIQAVKGIRFRLRK